LKSTSRVGYTTVWSGIHECKSLYQLEYSITYLFHDRRARANMGFQTGHAWLHFCESGLWDVLTPDTVLRDR